MKQALHTILVVDDDRRLRDLISQFIRDAGYRVLVAANAAEARVHLTIQGIDMMILDIMMPGETGLALAKSLRDGGDHTPVLFLTARDTLDDRVAGLEIGGDDYLSKPFEPPELLARTRAILRRTQPKITEQKSHHLLFGELLFLQEEGILQRNGEAIFLSSTEIILLKTMAQTPRHPFSRQDLAQRIGHRVTDRAVDVQITRLRKKIGDDPRQPRYIQTVRHIGYALCPD
jgi:two-component system phosphate regulon response regulator OmpR